MTTLSVPINDGLLDFINEMISSHKAETKAEVVRRALYKMREEEAINDILEASQDVKDGKIIRGDIDEILNRFIKD